MGDLIIGSDGQEGLPFGIVPLDIQIVGNARQAWNLPFLGTAGIMDQQDLSVQPPLAGGSGFKSNFFGFLDHASNFVSSGGGLSIPGGQQILEYMASGLTSRLQLQGTNSNVTQSQAGNDDEGGNNYGGGRGNCTDEDDIEAGNGGSGSAADGDHGGPGGGGVNNGGGGGGGGNDNNEGGGGHITNHMAPHQGTNIDLSWYIMAIWRTSAPTLIIDISTALNKPASGVVFGGHELAYYSSLAVIFCGGVGQVLTASWLSGVRNVKRHHIIIGKAVWYASALPLLAILGVGGYRISLSLP